MEPDMDTGYALAAETAARIGTGLRFDHLDDPDPDRAWCVVVARGVSARTLVEGASEPGTRSASPTGVGSLLRHLLRRQ